MQSGFLHGYQYDLFISYSTLDVDWVQPFYEALRKDLNRWTKHNVFTFWDKEGLRPGDTWDKKLLHASANSAVLVPILTPRFFTSDYCEKELKSFMGGSAVSGDGAHRSRIFPVELLCPAPQGHWLTACQAKQFCRKNLNGNPIEFTPGSAEFKDALRDLAVAISEVLPITKMIRLRRLPDDPRSTWPITFWSRRRFCASLSATNMKSFRPFPRSSWRWVQIASAAYQGVTRPKLRERPSIRQDARGGLPGNGATRVGAFQR